MRAATSVTAAIVTGWLGLMSLAAPGPASAQEPSGTAAALAIETAVIDAIDKAERSVVAIARVPRERPRASGVLDDPSIPFLPEPSPSDPDFVPLDYGSGVIVDAAGYIVTNQHVIGDATRYRYWVWVNRRPFPAEVQASDPWLDLAVLKIAAERLEAIKLGDAGKVRKGQLAISLGNPHAIARDGLPSASWGIVANLSRKAPPLGAAGVAPATPGAARRLAGGETLHQFGTLIQTDCRLQWGASGGALINLRGELIGLTSALAGLDGADAAAGFAIPADDTFRRALEQLRNGKTPEYGFLGVAPELQPLEKRQRGQNGVRVGQIMPGTPAAKSQLRADDVITRVADVAVADPSDLIRELSRWPADADVRLTVQRTDRPNGKPQELEVPVRLAKKFVGGLRPAFEMNPPPTWRGARIEYATAIADFGERVRDMDPDGCVAVIDVAKDSPAWSAGLRPGAFVSLVNAQRVTKPREFFGAVEGQEGPVDVQLVGDGMRAAPRVVTVGGP